MNTHSRTAQWLEGLDPSAKQKLLDLNLQAGDLLPEEVVSGLRDHGVHPAEWSQPGIGYVVPGELLTLLEGLRRT
ncbi:hypothetical protein [Streptomyces sp. NPDC094149]|uniref:hypothetical protein n=1 Tax=Streptomyces sp. NPDC094149 TaxID=3155079 RepID=UPI00331EB2E6